MMKKKIINFCLILAILFAIVMPISVAKGRDGQNFGIITVNGKEMYKSKYGEVYPIIIFNGEKCIKWHGFEIIPVEDVINCETGKSNIMLKNFLNDYQKKYNENYKPDIHINWYSPGDKDGYSQGYYVWANERVGNSSDPNDTIGKVSCLLTSTVAQLKRYGLRYTDNGHNDISDPVNINKWFIDHHSFDSNAYLYYDKIKDFPGIFYVINGFDDFSLAQTILYRSPPNAPIECFRSQFPVAYYNGKPIWGFHFCLYVDGDGKNLYKKENGVWKLDFEEGKNHLVIDPGFNPSTQREGTVRTLNEVYSEKSQSNPYVRPDSGIFKVAYRNY